MKNIKLLSEFSTYIGDKIIATSDKFYVDPEVLQIISDLDNQLIGLKPVSLL